MQTTTMQRSPTPLSSTLHHPTCVSRSGSGTNVLTSSHLTAPPSTLDLRLHLDPTNSSSYSGSGTNLVDLSNNRHGNDGTIDGAAWQANRTRFYYDGSCSGATAPVQSNRNTMSATKSPLQKPTTTILMQMAIGLFQRLDKRNNRPTFSHNRKMEWWWKCFQI